MGITIRYPAGINFALYVVFQIQSLPSAEPAPNFTGDSWSSARLNAIRFVAEAFTGSLSGAT